MSKAGRPVERVARPASPPPPGPGRTTRIVLYAFGALGFVGVGLALWLGSRAAAPGVAPAGDARGALVAAGCTLRLVAAPANASEHSVRDPNQMLAEWATDPPTAGPHYARTAVYGAYTRPLQQARVVHNLEHGAVAIQYGPGVPRATVAALRRFYDAHPNGTLLAPYPPLGRRIALGAWIAQGGAKGQGVLATCRRFDRVAFAAFLAAYQFKGPERFPPDSMTPGSS